MGRLLDMEEIIKVAQNKFPNEDVLKIVWVLTHTPTAYDVEKVVEEIEELRVDDNYNCIDIVRKGGIDG